MTVVPPLVSSAHLAGGPYGWCSTRQTPYHGANFMAAMGRTSRHVVVLQTNGWQSLHAVLCVLLALCVRGAELCFPQSSNSMM